MYIDTPVGDYTAIGLSIVISYTPAGYKGYLKWQWHENCYRFSSIMKQKLTILNYFSLLIRGLGGLQNRIKYRRIQITFLDSSQFKIMTVRVLPCLQKFNIVKSNNTNFTPKNSAIELNFEK